MNNDINLIQFRLDKLEEIVEKLADNQLALTRIEASSAENTRLISKIADKVDYHGKVMDEWSEELAVLKTEVGMHKAVIRLIGGAIITGLMGALLSIILI